MNFVSDVKLGLPSIAHVCDDISGSENLLNENIPAEEETIIFNVTFSPNPFIIYKITDFHSRCSNVQITRF